MILAVWSLGFNFAFGGRGAEQAEKEASEVKFRGELEGTKFIVGRTCTCLMWHCTGPPAPCEHHRNNCVATVAAVVATVVATVSFYVAAVATVNKVMNPSKSSFTVATAAT